MKIISSLQTIKKKESVKETKSKTGADTAELQKYINSVDLFESRYYSQYGYMQFAALLEKAKVYIQEGTYTEKEISSLLAELEKSQNRLINIKKYVDILDEVYAGNDQAQKVKADKLLKELLSTNLYVEGRNNKIDYKLFYRLKTYNDGLVKKKIARLEKAYDSLKKRSIKIKVTYFLLMLFSIHTFLLAKTKNADTLPEYQHCIAGNLSRKFAFVNHCKADGRQTQ